MTLIGIVSAEDDLHARAIERTLITRHGVACARLAVDRIASSGRVSWTPDYAADATVPTADGGQVAIGDVAAIWLRRPPRRQIVPAHLDRDDRIDADCAAALRGALLTGFRGTWVSDPVQTRMAQDRQLQLQAALAAGLRIPRTLVSSDPTAIRAFVAREAGGAVVKRLTDAGGFTGTTRVDPQRLADHELAAAPAMYQEAVAGAIQVRAHLIGERVLAARVESDELDWRTCLDVRWQPHALDEATTDALRAVQRILGLDMGIYDLRVTPGGEAVFLEAAPQGQFLFVEGSSGLPITAAIAELLVEHATTARLTIRAA